MSGDEEIIIRGNGTLKHWLNYEVVFGGKPAGEYKIEGGIRIKGKWLVVGVAVAALVLAGFVL